MVLSQRFYDQLTKLEQMGEWTKLPDDHPDIKMLQLYADLDDKYKAAGRRKVALYDKGGRFFKMFNNSTEAGKLLGVRADAIQKAARGDSRYCKGFEVRYIGGN